MKLRRWILKWLSDDTNEKYGAVISTDCVTQSRPNREGLNFILYPAVGGHILECRYYDHKVDRNNSTLYMVHEDQDFADQVAKSIMIEMMKQ
jgi:hypothetical protein